jgi:hypothetical protein
VSSLAQHAQDVTADKVRMVKAAAFRYITDALTPEEALAMLKEKEAGKKQREEEVTRRGYPAYTTSAGWLGELYGSLSRQS